MDANSPQPPPEALLLQAALRRMGLSARQAAKRVPISDTRWRHIVSGYQPAGPGHKVPVIATPDTLARMAKVVGVTPQQLTEAGREDAAAVLTELTGPPSPASAGAPQAGIGGPGGADPQVDAITALLNTLSPAARDEVLRRLQSQQAAQPSSHEQTTGHRHAG
jgi:hypothetical protein